MQFNFWKYQANGNDFIIADNRDGRYALKPDRIMALCDRKFGIGADGMMLLGASEHYDYEMHYYNADGKLASMCGNGGRCIALCAFLNNIGGNKQVFHAFDGLHQAVIRKEIVPGRSFDVSLQMGDVHEIESQQNFYFLDTGSPHYVEFVDRLAEIDVVGEGRKTRNSELFSPDGTNVNFVEMKSHRIFVRTYERGVEDETLSCGTGVTASALAFFLKTGTRAGQIHTTGGDFELDFDFKEGAFTNIWLKGPASFVFSGSLEI